MIDIPAKPYAFAFDPETTALVVIDMQRDFMEPGGFGSLLGNDVSMLTPTIEPLQRVLAAARDIGMTIIHTREGHRPDLLDCPPAKRARGGGDTTIGDRGPTAASWSAASAATTSSTSSRRCPARSCSTSPARARSTPPTSS